MRRASRCGGRVQLRDRPARSHGAFSDEDAAPPSSRRPRSPTPRRPAAHMYTGSPTPLTPRRRDARWRAQPRRADGTPVGDATTAILRVVHDAITVAFATNHARMRGA